MKKILFCGGGSAGHVTPNMAVIERLGGDILAEYAGTDGIERDICLKAGINFYTFSKVKLVRGNLFKNVSLPFKLIKAVKEAGAILDKTKPDIVFCKGGYASLPPAVAAKKRDIPVFTHECDLSFGLANKIISRFCVKTFTSFPETAQNVRRGFCSGPPIRKKALAAERNTNKKGANKTILVFGGSGGSRVINDVLHSVAPILCRNYDVIHICGKGNMVASNIANYRQIEYHDDMGGLYASADLAVARCGSNSAFELIKNKVPALFIPLENSRSRGDQVQNARYFLKRGLCHVLRQKDLTPENLLREIGLTLTDEKLAAALAACNINEGGGVIASELKNFLGVYPF